MSSPRRKFQRKLGTRRYPKLFVIATEGFVTEPQYFQLFNSRQSIVQVKCLKHKSRNSPPQVLKRLQGYLNAENLRKTDEAWLVVDKDQWTDDQLEQLFEWSNSKANYGFALSNPKFEYWLLLHFDDGHGINSSHEYTARLQHHLPNYEKSIDSQLFPLAAINAAVQRAENRDTPPCPDWPRTIGTTVYRLVRKIQYIEF